MQVRINLLRNLGQKKNQQVGDVSRTEKLRELLPVPYLLMVILSLGSWAGGSYFARSHGRKLQQELDQVRDKRQRIVQQLESLKEVDQQLQLMAIKQAEIEKQEQVFKALEEPNSKVLPALKRLFELMPENVWLTKLRTESGQINLEGRAETFLQVSSYVTKINESGDFGNVNLGSPQSGPGQKWVDFTLSLQWAWVGAANTTSSPPTSALDVDGQKDITP